jgi:putative transposase
MARRLRIEYPGARHHVINRGNYRRDLFETVGAAEAFLRVLFEGPIDGVWPEWR